MRSNPLTKYSLQINRPAGGAEMDWFVCLGRGTLGKLRSGIAVSILCMSSFKQCCHCSGKPRHLRQRNMWLCCLRFSTRGTLNKPVRRASNIYRFCVFLRALSYKMAAQSSTAIKFVLHNVVLGHVLWGTTCRGDLTWVRVSVGSLPRGDGVGLGRTLLRSVRGLVRVIAGGWRLRLGSGTVVCSPGVVMRIHSLSPPKTVRGEVPHRTGGDPACAEHSGSKGVNFEKQSPILRREHRAYVMNGSGTVCRE
jgi:hypothetical protein